jgi:hypothetical protein
MTRFGETGIETPRGKDCEQLELAGNGLEQEDAEILAFCIGAKRTPPTKGSVRINRCIIFWEDMWRVMIFGNQRLPKDKIEMSAYYAKKIPEINGKIVENPYETINQSHMFEICFEMKWPEGMDRFATMGKDYTAHSLGIDLDRKLYSVRRANSRHGCS